LGPWSEAAKVRKLAQLLGQLWEAEKAVVWVIRLVVGWEQLLGGALGVAKVEESEPQLVVWLEMARVLELEAGLEPRLVGLLERRKVPTMERKEKSIS